VAVYHGTQDSRETFAKYLETPGVDPAGYVEYTARWEELVRPDWEENPGSAFPGSDQVLGVSFGLEGPGEAPYKGMLWIDNVTVKKFPGSAQAEQTSEVSSTAESAQEPGGSPLSKLPCPGSALLPIFLFGLFLVRRK
jgi:hypothetical protein